MVVYSTDDVQQVLYSTVLQSTAQYCATSLRYRTSVHASATAVRAASLFVLSHALSVSDCCRVLVPVICPAFLCLLVSQAWANIAKGSMLSWFLA